MEKEKGQDYYKDGLACYVCAHRRLLMPYNPKASLFLKDNGEGCTFSSQSLGSVPNHPLCVERELTWGKAT